MRIIASGTGQGAGDVTLPYTTVETYIKSAAGAVVSFNGHNIAIANTNIYQEFEIDASKFTVVSGTVDFYVLGSS